MPKSDWYRTKYLRSEHWQQLRLSKLSTEDNRCAGCGKQDPSNDVHHLHYRNLWDVGLDDLMVFCRMCHEAAHEVLDALKSGDVNLIKQAERRLRQSKAIRNGILFPQKGRLFKMSRELQKAQSAV